MKELPMKYLICFLLSAVSLMAANPAVTYNQLSRAATPSGLQFTNLNTKVPGVSNVVTFENVAIEFVTPDMFGAVAATDGSTTPDNSVAMQRWLNYLGAHTNRSQGWIPSSGIYNFASPLFMTNSGVTIAGAGETGDLGSGTWSGSHLRYTGTTGYGLVIGHTNATANRVYLKNFRMSGVYGQTPHPNGILLQNCSVSEMENVQINGALIDALTIIDSTLFTFKRLNILACTNAVVIRSTHVGVEFPESGALTFSDGDFYQIGTGWLVKSSVNSVSLNNCYVESSTNVIRIQPDTTEVSLSVYDWHVQKGQYPTSTSWYSNSRLMLVDFTGTNSYSLSKITFEDGWSWNDGADYAVQINVGTNVPAFRYIRNIEFRNWTGSGSQIAFLTNDFSFAQINFSGATSATDGYVGGGSAVPLRVGTGYYQTSVQELGSLDARDSGPWNLPENLPATLRAGQYMYSTSSARPQWRNLSAWKPVASTDDLTGMVTGSGSVNRVPKFTAASVIGDTAIEDTGSTIVMLGRNISIGSDTGDATAKTVFQNVNGSIVGGWSTLGSRPSWFYGSTATGGQMYMPAAGQLATSNMLQSATLRMTAFTTATTTYTITANDFTVLLDTSSAGFTATLPSAASVPGKILVIKKISADGNTGTISRSGSDKIDDSNTVDITTQFDVIRLQSNGVLNWWKL